MFIYNYHPETKEFHSKSLAKLNPLESEKQKKKIYLKPVNSTFVKPERKKGFVPVWIGDKWENKRDRRGEKYFLPGDSREYTIKSLDQSIPKNALVEIDEKALKIKNVSEANFVRKKILSQLKNKLEVKSNSEVWNFSIESVNLFNALVALGDPFEWRPKGKNYKTLSKEDALKIARAIKIKLQSIDVASQKDKAAYEKDDYSNINLKTMAGS